jgi:hypothetical protein
VYESAVGGNVQETPRIGSSEACIDPSTLDPRGCPGGGRPAEPRVRYSDEHNSMP